MPLGDRIKELRLKNGESLQQLADAISASKAHVWEIESNRSKNPSIDLLQRLAEHFKTTVAFLIDESQGDLTLADQFFRKNSQKLSAMTDADFQFFEQMLNRISDGNKS